MKNEYDKLLIQGLSKLMDLEFSYVSEIQDVDYTFSNKYRSKKEKLIKNLGHSYWKFVNTFAKKVAVIIISLVIAFSSLMTVDAFREKVFSFVYKIYQTFTEVKPYKNHDDIDIDVYYSISDIPSDYTIYLINKDSPHRNFIFWTDNKQNYISFTQTDLSRSNQFNSEHGVLEETVINDTPCLTCKTTTDYFCYWEYDGYRFELIYPTDLGEEFMSEVVGNLVEIDPAELEN